MSKAETAVILAMLMGAPKRPVRRTPTQLIKVGDRNKKCARCGHKNKKCTCKKESQK